MEVVFCFVAKTYQTKPGHETPVRYRFHFVDTFARLLLLEFLLK